MATLAEATANTKTVNEHLQTGIWSALTASDASDGYASGIFRAIMRTDGDGAVSIQAPNGSTNAVLYCLRGVVYPCLAVRINSTDTTAGTFVVMF